MCLQSCGPQPLKTIGLSNNHWTLIVLQYWKVLMISVTTTFYITVLCCHKANTGQTAMIKVISYLIGYISCWSLMLGCMVTMIIDIGIYICLYILHKAVEGRDRYAELCTYLSW